MPRVSVIVPNYNHAPYLPRRLDSVLGQTFGDFELIVLDDASPDNSRDVIDNYSWDPRVVTAFNEANSGNTFRQWQKGLALATGEYVWIAESDDAAAPEFLECMVAALDAEPDAFMAVCNTITIDENDNELVHFFAKWPSDGIGDYDLTAFDRNFAMLGRDYIARYLTPWNTIPNASAVLFRRRALAEVDMPPSDMRLCGDWLIYARLLQRGNIVRVAASMNYFREHRVNVRSRYRGRQFIEESMIVQREMATTIGRPIGQTLARIGQGYAHILVDDMSAGQRLLPLSRWPSAIVFGASVGWEVASRVAVNLVRQRAGALRRRLFGSAS